MKTQRLTQAHSQILRDMFRINLDSIQNKRSCKSSGNRYSKISLRSIRHSGFESTQNYSIMTEKKSKFLNPCLYLKIWIIILYLIFLSLKIIYYLCAFWNNIYFWYWFYCYLGAERLTKRLTKLYTRKKKEKGLVCRKSSARMKNSICIKKK